MKPKPLFIIMQEVVLIYPTREGSQEIAVEGEKMSFGRGSEADFRFEDDGLSRLHATIYSDGKNVWIVDENSTNGTFVNGEKTGSSGTPLRNGDSVKIGHFTTLKVKINQKQAADLNQTNSSNTASASISSKAANPAYFIPLAIIGIAFLVITASAVFIGVTSLGSENNTTVKREEKFDSPVILDKNENIPDKTPSPTPENEIENSKRAEIVEDETDLTDSPQSGNDTNNINQPVGKKYSEMSESEKVRYVEIKALRVARMIGNSESKSIPPAAVEKIKYWVDGYIRRTRAARKDDCSGSGWVSSDLISVLERASKNAPFIIRAFNERGIDPQIGIYLAMIESEHCVCLQSNTGPLGMFQFTFATAKTHYNPNDRVIKGASPSSPDVRCEPEPSARAAASYMKALTLRFGTGPLSVPLAIGSYNSGEGGLSKNLKDALEKNETQERSFWTLVANADNLSKQFQLENVKYVPKFFAAAIVGENPQDFGIKLRPLSTYSK